MTSNSQVASNCIVAQAYRFSVQLEKDSNSLCL